MEAAVVDAGDGDGVEAGLSSILIIIASVEEDMKLVDGRVTASGIPDLQTVDRGIRVQAGGGEWVLICRRRLGRQKVEGRQEAVQISNVWMRFAQLLSGCDDEK